MTVQASDNRKVIAYADNKHTEYSIRYYDGPQSSKSAERFPKADSCTANK